MTMQGGANLDRFTTSEPLWGRNDFHGCLNNPRVMSSEPTHTRTISHAFLPHFPLSFRVVYPITPTPSTQVILKDNSSKLSQKTAGRVLYPRSFSHNALVLLPWGDWDSHGMFYAVCSDHPFILTSFSFKETFLSVTFGRGFFSS